MGRRSKSQQRASRKRNNALRPELYRPERAEIERQADAFVQRYEARQTRIQRGAVAILAGVAGGMVIAVLSALGVL
jgi:hypothetical protein